jgi:3-dehydroquinate dehydratase-1
MKRGQIKSIQGLISAGRTLVVGTLHERTGLQRIRRGGSALSGLDLLEVRLDCLDGAKLPEEWPLPVIATARHPDEGGSNCLSKARRAALLYDAVSWSASVDVELRSARALAPVIAEAHQHGRTVILSHHDFKATPSLKSLRSLAAKAAESGADLFKVATFLRDRSDLMTLIEFQAGSSPVPVVAMGMGNAGRFSRMVLAGFGAPLCYGWLGKPQVPGQWPAMELRSLLNGVLPA